MFLYKLVWLISNDDPCIQILCMFCSIVFRQDQTMLNKTFTQEQIEEIRLSIEGDLSSILKNPESFFNLDDYLWDSYCTAPFIFSQENLAIEYLQLKMFILTQVIAKPKFLSIRKRGLDLNQLFDLLEKISDPKKGLIVTVKILKNAEQKINDSIDSEMSAEERYEQQIFDEEYHMQKQLREMEIPKDGLLVRVEKDLLKISRNSSKQFVLDNYLRKIYRKLPNAGYEDSDGIEHRLIDILDVCRHIIHYLSNKLDYIKIYSDLKSNQNDLEKWTALLEQKVNMFSDSDKRKKVYDAVYMIMHSKELKKKRKLQYKLSQIRLSELEQDIASKPSEGLVEFTSEEKYLSNQSTETATDDAVLAKQIQEDLDAAKNKTAEERNNDFLNSLGCK